MPEKELWYNMPAEKAVEILKTDAKSGLSSSEAGKRLKKYGPNKLPEEKPLSWLQILWEQFKSPLVYILVIAAIISLALGEFIDMGIIVAAILVNTVIGFFQEYKADRTLWKLKQMMHPRAIVVRDGVERRIDAEGLVPGDIILLSEGNKVPADARLIDASDLQIVEAALTGESMPSNKEIVSLDRGVALADRENMVFMGTQIDRGVGTAVVVSTGLDTQLGKIASMVEEIDSEKTPLQKQFARLSRDMSIILLGMCVLVFVVGILKQHSFFEMLLTSIALAVAAIPEGLPAATAICLAIGMQQIFKHSGLVKKMVAAETLGSTTVICTDKTGTLTEGKMAVSEIVVGSGVKTSDLKSIGKKGAENGSRSTMTALKIGLLCNNAAVENPGEDLGNWKIIGDPTEKALLLAATQAGLDKRKLEAEMPRLDEIPFDSQKKYMATMHEAKEEGKKFHVAYVKGAPEKIMGMCSFVDTDGKPRKLENAAEIEKQVAELTGRGLRVLALAYKRLGGDGRGRDFLKGMVFVGLMGLKDPLREEAKETIALCRRAGIRPVIITGDHKLTAQAIGQELGLKIRQGSIMEGSELDSMSDEELKKAVKKVVIYARVEPKHKLRIVDAWQSKGEVVAMTGDGVNDAPALKSADIGVALGSGTDVAKETAEIVLLDNNFKTIVKAVEWGRVIFENIRKVTLYLLADSFCEIILIGGALILGLPLPVIPAQILWINLVEDGLPNTALAFEPGEREVMNDPPRKRKAPILNFEMKLLIFIIGLINDAILLFLFWWMHTSGNYEISHIRTIIFVTLGLDSLFYVFSCRSMRFTIFQKNPFANKLLVGAVLIGLGFLLSGVYFTPFQKILRTVPLALDEWIIPLSLSVLGIILIEVTKWIFIARHKHDKKEFIR